MITQSFTLYLIVNLIGSLHSPVQDPIIEEIHIKIDELDKTKNFSELFDHIEYVPIDPSVLIDQIIDLEFTHNRIIILERTFGGERNLYIYDRQGKLLRKLDGNAIQGGFIGAYDFMIDHENSRIQILDVTERKVVDFSMDGEFINETYTVDDIIFHFFMKHPTSKQYVFHCGNEVTHNDRYNIFYIDEDLKNIQSREQYIPNHILSMGFMYSPFARSNEKDIYYKEWYNDTVFYVGDTSLVPKYLLKFDNYEWLTEEELNKISRDNISYIIKEIDGNPNIISEIRNFVDRKNHLLMTFNYNKKRYWCTYDKRTKESEFFLLGENDLDSGVNPTVWHFNTQKSIVFNVNSTYVTEFYRQLYENKTPEELEKMMATDFKNFASLVDKVKDSSNPVLMIADFNEDF